MAPVGRPPKYQNVEEIEELIEEYFRLKDAQGDPYTITGLAIALGMSRQQLIEYQNRDEFHDAIKTARERCQEYAERYLYSGKAVAGAIFSLKNNYGWKDKTEVENNINVKFSLADLHKGTQQLEEAQSTVEVIENQSQVLNPANNDEEQITNNWKTKTILIEDEAISTELNPANKYG